MAISPELEAQILRYYHAGQWRVGTIARQLLVHHGTVERVLDQAGLRRIGSARKSRIDAYLPFILDTLEKFPTLTAARLFAMVKQRGYRGNSDHFGHIVIGRARRPLMAFVLVLAWSRKIYLFFFLGAHMENFLRGHVGAFAAWGGVPRVIWYDNLKSAVLERSGQAIRYIRDAFFAGRTFTTVDDLNVQAAAWCNGDAADRKCPEDTAMTVREAFLEESASLMVLPDNPCMTDERVEVSVGKTPYVRFDWNDYSVPPDAVPCTLTVVASLQQVRVLDGQKVLATHKRSYDKRAQIEDPAHIQQLVEYKHKASQHRSTDRLLQAAPLVQEMLKRAAARNYHRGSITRALTQLLDSYGATELQSAVQDALARDVPHPNAVRLALVRSREAKNLPPPVTVILSEHVRSRDVPVRLHALATYDQLTASSGDAPEVSDVPA